MAERNRQIVLFLGTANHDRSRAAEVLFNAVAGRMGLSWRAASRGLRVEASKLKGPVAAPTLTALHAHGVRDPELTRPPQPATPADLEAAVRLVAFSRDELEPILREQFPDRCEAVEYWSVAPGDVAAIEREVMHLVTRLLGGRTEVPDKPVVPVPQPPPRKVLTAKVGRETAGRKGKGVTTVFGLPLSEAQLRELAATLKQRCGTGGTVKDGRIEIQGDNRDRVMAELERLGYAVKRVGG